MEYVGIEPKRPISRNVLKYIAVMAMLIDHIGAIFVPQNTAIYIIMRIIGRLTCPIMCYFLVQGYMHTKNRKKYFLRLLIFAIIAQVPYALALKGTLLVLELNFLFTLVLSFGVIWVYDKTDNLIVRWLAIILLISLAFFCDWGVFAPVLVLLFYIFRNNNSSAIISFAIFVVMYTFLNFNPHDLTCLLSLATLLAIPLILLYNGEAGRKCAFNKWFFYIFYPLHLGLLWVVRLTIG